MKKQRIFLLLLLVLTLSACGRKAPAEPLPEETLPETTAAAEPAVEYMTAQINGIPAVLETRNRGDSLDLAGRFDEKHYIVKLDRGYGLVEKNLIRLDTEAAYDPWTGYAYPDAKVFGNYRMAGDPLQILPENTPVEVLEDLNWCCLVKVNGESGYMKQESLSRDPLTGQNGSTEATGEEGGNIYLSFRGAPSLLASIAPQEGSVTGKATVLADETQIVLGYFDRGDRIPVVKETARKGLLRVYLDGLYAEISDEWVLPETQAPAEPRNALTDRIVSVYPDQWMQDSPIDRLNANTRVQVLCELEDCCLVEINGVTGYVAKTHIVPAVEPAPAETEPQKATAPTQAPAKPGKKPSATEPSKPAAESAPTETTAPAETTSPTEAPTEPTPTQPTKAPEWTPPVL